MAMEGDYIMALIYYLFWALSISRIAYGQPGFISLDCGGEESYNDMHNIQWTSDQQYIKAGVKGTIPPANINQDVDRPLRHLRFFTSGKRNCYTLPAVMGTKYIIRASFLYGDYDGLQSQPVFDLLIDANYWDTVVILSKEDIIKKEVIAMAKSKSISLCVARSGDKNDKNTTFISSLELRPILPSMYDLEGVGETYSLINVLRQDDGLMSASSLRYPEDEFDRIWTSSVSPNLFVGNTTSDIPSEELFAIPSAVMRTALLTNGSNYSISWQWTVPRPGLYLVVICFAEIQKRPTNSIREFNITAESGARTFYNRVTLPDYPESDIYYLSNKSFQLGNINFSLHASSRSNMGPLLNAWEIYEYRGPLNKGTYTKDADAIAEIARSFNLEKESTGDPCLPHKYSWDWVVCNGSSSPRIVEVILSGKCLNGTIPLSFGNLSDLINLDLGRNNLNGSIPNCLGQLSKLKTLNLSNNKLSGYVPNALLDKQLKGQLVLRINGNENIRLPRSCKDINKKKGAYALIISIVIVMFTVAAVASTLIVFIKREPIKELSNIHTFRSFSHEEVSEMTHMFNDEIGNGGYGTVFRGDYQGKDVAVKVLSNDSHQGEEEFLTEVKTLSKIHHRNVVKLLGYCIDKESKILIYEYMSNGDLRKFIEGNNPSGDAKNWETRLNIALHAAQGLEYLHMGCNPPVIHRDIKSSNILLNNRMEAKIGDFGLSKTGPSDGATHVSTKVKGTFGYLAHEYMVTRRLTTKCDVYSFGIVLMQIISGLPPVIPDPSPEEAEVGIASWMREMFKNDQDVNRVADPSLVEVSNSASMLKVVKLAIACCSPEPTNRPDMSNVVGELKGAILTREIELSEMESALHSEGTFWVIYLKSMLSSIIFILRRVFVKAF